MDFNYKDLLPENFDALSRVWVYQCSRILTLPEALQVEEILNNFTANWKSHGTEVKGYANLFFGQFVIFMADETAAGVSGCSTDSSVKIVKQIELAFGVDMFNRQNLAFIVKDKIQLLPLAQLNYAFENNFINAHTLYFNNLVATKEQFENKWMIPVKDSWLAKRIKPTPLPEQTSNIKL